ncbi:MAG: ribonuclease J [Bradyrhizobiaceae bacterium]|nr:ribonuclease J [Bradyrhizobiaceae bacterium]
MNLSIYGVGSPRRKAWLAVDLGVAFAGDDLPGIEVILPDVRFLDEERRNLVGLVLTHAHEDHYGAIVELWPRLRVPIFATRFTASLLEAKRLSEPGAPEIPVTVVPPGGRFKVPPFDVELVPVAHSIPESNALIIRTPCGTVLHTGDWKIDKTPLIGPPTDEVKLRRLGEEGCLAVIGDSTNAIRDGRSPSERDVASTLAGLIASAPGRVAVTTFASNVARVQAVAEAARACGREVVLVGRAMERIVQVARETGYLKGVPEFRGTDVYGYLPRDKVVALCTGSQGEHRAALARIARDEHPDVTLGKGDRVIFSSRTIPGNERPVGRVINGLVRQGIEVITDRTHLVHVSGHPRRAELEEMYGWVRPRILVPVHGEALHLAEHAALGRKLGVPETLTCRNGDVVRLAPGPAQIIDELPQGQLYRDGRLIISAEQRTVADRRRLGFSGVVSIAFALDVRGDLAGSPVVESLGIPELTADGRRLDDVAHEAVAEALDSLPRARRRDPDSVADAVKRAVRAAVAVPWGKKPLCLVHVLAL